MSKTTRRSFLEHTLYTAAAAFAAERLVGAAEPAASPASQPVSASGERVRVATIGVNGRGLTHLESWTFDDQIDVVAICDVDPSTYRKAQRVLKSRGRPEAKTYQDIRKLLEDKSIDAVSVATPNHWHTLAGIWAMQAGKNAYVEKPVSHNVSEGRRLEEARVKYGRVCQGGTQSRTFPAMKKAMKFIHEGGIGKVVLARGLCYKRRDSIGHFADSTAPANVAYDTWLGPAPERPFNKNRFHYQWHWNWDYGNGDIGNQGIHQMDIARWALNKEYPTSVMSLGGRFGYQDDGQTPNTQLAIYDYGDAHLLFEVRGLPTPGLKGVTVGNIIYGTDGYVAFNSEEEATIIAFDTQGKKTKTFKGGGNHFDNFIQACRTGKQDDLNAPVLETHRSSALCHLGNTSFRLGEPQPITAPVAAAGTQPDLAEAFGRYKEHLAASVDEMKKPLNLQAMSQIVGPTLAFDGKTETYGDNAKANAFLTREYRAPFVVPKTL